MTSALQHDRAAGSGDAAGGVPALAADRSVPALIVKIGRYPLHHGGVGAIRTLGRLGVPVYAITEDRFTPAAVSRYCQDSFVWPTSGRESSEEIVAGMLAIGHRLGRRAVVIPTDEEAAVLIGEHADELSECFLFPRVRPDLPRKLASKQGLYELCLEHAVPAPASGFPETAADLAAFAATARFPVVAKNREAWVRLSAPAVPGTTLVRTPEELLALGREWGDTPSVILQDYIPPADAQDWIVHLYCDASSNPVVTFTGVKVRSWPPRAGMTACAYTVPNPALARMAERFCRAIGFAGVADLDWRLDLRDGQYKLVDFNPRAGAQFRLFETTAGVDVVRALHLDLTGRTVPAGTQVDGRRLIVENIDGPARLTRHRSASAAVPAALSATSTELAWLARDDPFPALVMSARLAAPAVAHFRQVWRARAVRRRAALPAAAGGGAAARPRA